jgi:hypothetical protein
MGVILNLLSVFLKLALGGIGWLGQVTYGATRAFAEVAVQELKAIRKVVPYGENKPLRSRLTVSLHRKLGLPPGAGTPSARPGADHAAGNGQSRGDEQ